MIASANKLRQMDSDFERFLETVLIEAEETELTPEKRKQRRARADADRMAFCKIYYPAIFDAPWNGLHRWLADLDQGKYTCSGFRKSGKSAFTYIGHAVRDIAMKRRKMINVSLRTLEKSRTRTLALRNIIARNRLLCYDYDIEIQRDKIGEYVINFVTLIASSFETGLRAVYSDDFKRIDLSINDDLYDYTTVKSDADNEQVDKFVQGEIYGALEDHGLSLTLGNRIHDNCPIVRLAALKPEHHFSLPARDENGESNWPERYSNDYWRMKEAETAQDIWDGDYMDTPPRKGDIFDSGWIKHINLNLTQILCSISAIDPSHGSSPQACLKAIVTGGVTDKNELVVQDMYGRKEPYNLVFDYMDALRGRIKNHKVFLFEDDFNQWSHADPYYRDWLKQNKKPLPIVRHLSKELKTEQRAADKDSRIVSLVHPHQSAMVLYAMELQGSRDFKLFMSQYQAYGGTSKEKLDLLDALATLYIMAFRYIKTGSFKALKQRTFKRLESFWSRA